MTAPDKTRNCTTCAHRRRSRNDVPCVGCPKIVETHELRGVLFQNWMLGMRPAAWEYVELPPGISATDLDVAVKGPRAQAAERLEEATSIHALADDIGKGGIDPKSNDFWKRREQASTHLSRTAVLDTAKELITGPREQEYGTPQANFEAIAAMWNVMLAGKLKSVGDCPISAVDVALCMVAVKMARARVTPEKGDTYIDMAGYAALAAELAGAE